jgi:hypothetical protein
LINKNRELLERKLQIIENYTVNVTEDSICSDTMPHSKPPQILQSVEGGVTPVKMESVVDYYVKCTSKISKTSNVTKDYKNESSNHQRPFK